MLLGVAVVSSKNRPLLVLPTSDRSDEPLLISLHFSVHSALDLVEERLASPPISNYLGLLGICSDHAVYCAILGASHLKVFAVFEADSDPTPKDEDVRILLVNVHSAYVDWASNPFVKFKSLALVDCPEPIEGGTGVASLHRRLQQVFQSAAQT